MAMLSEMETIHERSHWKKVKTTFDRDPRYKAVDSSTQREEWFKEYVRSLASKVSEWWVSLWGWEEGGRREQD